MRHVRLMARAVGASIALCALLAPAPAAAEDPALRAAARKLGTEGVRLALDGRCQEAIPKLERANELLPAPSVQTWLGRCQIEVGQVVQGTETLNRVVRLELADDAPRAFHEAKEQARQLLAEVQGRIAQLVIVVEPEDAAATVSLDGQALPAAILGVERPTDPGTHEIVAEADGYRTARARVTLGAGGHERVVLRLEPLPEAAPPPQGITSPPGPPGPPPGLAAPGPEAPAPPRDTHEAGGSSPVLGYALLGVGGVGVAVGSVFGALALSSKSELKELCPDNRCSTNPAIDRLNTARTQARIATIGFGVGAAGLVPGTVVLLTGSSGTAEAASLEEQRGVRPWIGLGSAGVKGAF